MRKVSYLASLGCVRRVGLRRNAPEFPYYCLVGGWLMVARKNGALRYR